MTKNQHKFELFSLVSVLVLGGAALVHRFNLY